MCIKNTIVYKAVYKNHHCKHVWIRVQIYADRTYEEEFLRDSRYNWGCLCHNGPLLINFAPRNDFANVIFNNILHKKFRLSSKKQITRKFWGFLNFFSTKYPKNVVWRSSPTTFKSSLTFIKNSKKLSKSVIFHYVKN